DIEVGALIPWSLGFHRNEAQGTIQREVEPGSGDRSTNPSPDPDQVGLEPIDSRVGSARRGHVHHLPASRNLVATLAVRIDPAPGIVARGSSPSVDLRVGA